MEDLGLIVAGAGSGRRFGPGRNKLLASLGGRPLLCHSLQRFLAYVRPEHVRVMAPPGLAARFQEVLAACGIPPSVSVLPGGATRQASVLLGLRDLPPEVHYVAVQDAARPLTSLGLLLACAESARERGSGVAAHPVTDTIKVVTPEGRVSETPARTSLRAAETPQVFRREVLLRAYEQVEAAGVLVTDDAQAAEYCGFPVFVVEHNEYNPKVTWPGDLEVLEHYLESVS